MDDLGDLNFDELDDLDGIEDFTLGDFNEQINFDLDEDISMPSTVIPKPSARKNVKELLSPAHSEVNSVLENQIFRPKTDEYFYF